MNGSYVWAVCTPTTATRTRREDASLPNERREYSLEYRSPASSTWESMCMWIGSLELSTLSLVAMTLGPNGRTLSCPSETFEDSEPTYT